MGSGRLKPGWTPVAFGDVVRQVKDHVDPIAAGLERYVAGEHMDTDDLHIHRWGIVGNGYLGPAFHARFRPRHILYGSRRTYLRKVAVADFEGVTANTTFVLETRDPNVLLPALLPFIMQTEAFHGYSIKKSKGSVNPYVNFSDIAAYEFALPPPEEQRRLATLLASVDVCRESLRGALDHLGTVEHAFLLRAFGEYGSCPRDATLVRLSDVAEVRQGLAKGRRANAATTTRPYLRVANVEDGRLNLREVKEIVVRKNDVDRYTLRNGDVLMTEGGDLDKLGRGTVWKDEVPGCLHQNHVFAVRTDSSRLEPQYLAAIARSHYGRSFFLLHAKRTSNLASVNKGEVSGFELPMRPWAVQRAWLSDYRLFTTTAVAMRTRRAVLLKMKEVLLRDLTPLDEAARPAQSRSPAQHGGSGI